jgi:1,4-alpha-glucan branching enzyme
MRTIFHVVFLFLIVTSAHAQAIVTLDPPFANGSSSVTLTYNADQGNGQLANLPAGTIVYAHIGITVNGQNWQYVVGNWGTADNRTAMTRIGNSNQYTLSLTPSIREWFQSYNTQQIPANATISKLCLVFRNATGTLQGKTSSNGDIFVDLLTGAYNAAITSHPQKSLLVNNNQTIQFTGQSSSLSILEFTLDDISVSNQTNVTSLNYSLNTGDLSGGFHTLVFSANNGAGIIRDTLFITKFVGTAIAELPANAEEGITYTDESTAYLQLRAPFKEFVYVLGDFNNWTFRPEYQMKKSPDGQFFWLSIPNLDPNREYRFQYHIDWEGMRVTDPYVEKILDPWNDQYISSSVYPNIPAYPTEYAEGIVGVLKTTEHYIYQWDNSYTYTKPPKEDLIVYEMHIRDFVASKSYQEVIDKLGYIKTLGVNAIELMPVAEFEGNDSWGYNPSFFMALDKAYGPKDKFKELIDSCHRNGIAVLIDVVFNHSFGQNPMVQMYFDPNAGDFGQPLAESPWFNPIPRHPFNVGYDFNHESEATNFFVKKVMKFWLQEYKIDGFRFDLSKGFTQTNTGSDVAAWGNYDQSRVDIILDYANYCRSVSNDPYLILEHLGAWGEEQQYADNGLMVWAKGTDLYNEATMGWYNGNNQNLYNITPNARGWNNYGVLAYAESHDEERLMYKNLNFGNSTNSYNTRSLTTALERMSLAACFLIPLPGPKMLWQFGEIGYDQSINRCPNGTISTDCRTAAKPILWYYYDNINRRNVFDTYRKLNYLKRNFTVFRDLGVGMELGPYQKWLRFDSNNLDAMIVGNFDVVAGSVNVNFTQTGKWYDYLSGDSINISNTNWTLNLAAGEYHVYLNQRVIPPVNSYGGEPNNFEDIESQSEIHIFPNPTQNEINLLLPLGGRDALITIYNLEGKEVYRRLNNGDELIQIETLEFPAGLYFCRVNQGGHVFTTKFIKQP